MIVASHSSFKSCVVFNVLYDILNSTGYSKYLTDRVNLQIFTVLFVNLINKVYYHKGKRRLNESGKSPQRQKKRQKQQNTKVTKNVTLFTSSPEDCL